MYRAQRQMDISRNHDFKIRIDRERSISTGMLLDSMKYEKK